MMSYPAVINELSSRVLRPVTIANVSKRGCGLIVELQNLLRPFVFLLEISIALRKRAIQRMNQ